MIHLDTNALIALPQWARQNTALVQRIAGGAPTAVSAVVWYEFLSGPVTAAEIGMARALICGRVVPISEDDALLAANLFNQTGRRRTLKTDTLIAAVAIRADASFATLNTDDFAPFTAHGLRLEAV
jgi:predicted nucleic acid-binding protein